MPTLDALPATIGPSEAARRLGVSAQRVRQLGAEGKLPVVRTKLGRLFPVDAVDALVAQRRAGTPPDRPEAA